MLPYILTKITLNLVLMICFQSCITFTGRVLVTCVNVAATLRSLSEWNVAATFLHVILHLHYQLYATYTTALFGAKMEAIHRNKYVNL